MGWLLLVPVVGACGTAKDTTADAFQMPVDAAPPVDAATHGMITATTLDYLTNNAPVAGVPVIIYAPDGTVASEMVSDANGTITGEVDVGGSVTAYYTSASRNSALTIVDVHPGDNLVFGISERNTASEGTFNVTFPPTAGATGYTVYGPCNSVSGAANTAVAIQFRKNCKPDQFDVFVVAQNASGPFSSAEALGVMRASSSVTLANIWTPLDNFNVGYQNFAANIPSIDFQRYAGFPSNGASSGTTVTTATGHTGSAQSSVRAGKYAYVTSQFSRPSGDPKLSVGQYITQRIDGKASSYALDIDAHRLPWIQGLTYDMATQTVAATLEHPSTISEVLVGLEFSRPVGGVTVQYEYIVMAPKLDKIKFPVLPAHLNVVYPASGSSFQVVSYMIDSTDGADWNVTRQSPIDLYFSTFVGSTTNTARLSFGSADVTLP